MIGTVRNMMILNGFVEYIAKRLAVSGAIERAADDPNR
jgi:hypothetical protein